MNAKLGNLDLLTPNRLLLDSSNDRSPVEPVKMTNNSDKIIKADKEFFMYGSNVG